MDWMMMNERAIAYVQKWVEKKGYPLFELGSRNYRVHCEYSFFLNYKVLYWPEGSDEAADTLTFLIPAWSPEVKQAG